MASGLGDDALGDDFRSGGGATDAAAFFFFTADAFAFGGSLDKATTFTAVSERGDSKISTLLPLPSSDNRGSAMDFITASGLGDDGVENVFRSGGDDDTAAFLFGALVTVIFGGLDKAATVSERGDKISTLLPSSPSITRGVQEEERDDFSIFLP